MASYQKDVWESDKPQKASDYQDYLTGLEKKSQTQQKQFGELGVQPTGYSGIQRQSAQGQFQQADTARRQQAAQNKYQLGSTIDTRRSQIADQLAALKEQKEGFNKDLATKQWQMEQEAGLGRKEQDWSTGQQIKELNFKEYVNDTDRADALTTAYNAGTAELDLIDAAQEGALKINDINNYFSILLNDIEQDFMDWEADKKGNWESAYKDLITKSKQAALFTTAITDLIKVGVDKWGKVDNNG